MRSDPFLGKFTSGCRSSVRRSDLLKVLFLRLTASGKPQIRQLQSVKNCATSGKPHWELCPRGNKEKNLTGKIDTAVGKLEAISYIIKYAA